MRMWNIPASNLCRQHLLGEHYEFHKFHHSFVNQENMDTRVKKGQIFPSHMKERHDEIVEEMRRRGYHHNSPYNQPDISYITVQEQPYFKEEN